MMRSATNKLITAFALAALILSPLTAQSALAASPNQQVSTGGEFTCALKDGGVKCVGENYEGQLGNGTTTTSLTSVVAIPVGSGATALSSGYGHTCAVVAGGVKCWGENWSGQLGIGTTTNSLTPVDVILNGLPLTGVTAISASSQSTCALISSSVKCWGANWSGQLGDGTTTNSPTPVDVILNGSALAGVTAVSVGGYHSCALISGSIKCWGANWDGQLGDGTTTNSLTPVDVILNGSAMTGVTAVSAHGGNTCALISGSVKCWGGNWDGQLGNGTRADSLTPVDVLLNGTTMTGVTAVSTGDRYTCAVVSGSVKCWGANWSGQLGNGTRADSLTPVDVLLNGLPLTGATDVSSNYEHTCALVTGEVKCWGINWVGQLGDGTSGHSLIPAEVTSIGSGVSAVSAGENHTCALVSGGVKCWGANWVGQLGNGTNIDSLAPVIAIAISSGVTVVSVGDAHTCAVVSGGVKCWGYNDDGQLGDGTTDERSSPVVAIAAGSGVTAISAGGAHTCAVVSGGVKCWGYNDDGQLGDGTRIDSRTPVDVILNGTALTGVTAISAGDAHTCAVVSGGVKCWGANRDGQLGDGTISRSIAPKDVIFNSASLSGVTAISAGNYFTCAVVTGGVKCWGDNDDGEGGNGSNTDSRTAVDVVLNGSALTGVTAISANDNFTCAVVSGGVKCWGFNEEGQLGVGTFDASSIPLDAIAPSSGATSISEGNEHICALVSGSLKCWGDNEDGQIGYEGRATTARASIVFGSVIAASVPVTSTNNSMQVSGISGSGLSRVITGSLLENVTSATVNGVAVTLSNVSTGSVQISIPELSSGNYDIVLKGTNGTLTWVRGLVIQSAAPEIKDITGFAGDSASLTLAHKAAIKAFVLTAKKLVCVGGAYSIKPSANDRKLAMARAKAACGYAKQISPAIVTTVSSSFMTKKSASGRMVKLTASN